MDEARRKRRDFLQNVIIVLLALSAVFLFMCAQIYNLSETQYLGFFRPAAGQTTGSDVTLSGGLSAPVRVAVTGSYGRYASVTATTEDEEFVALGRLLGETLGSANDAGDCGEEAFLRALNGTSVYYDFLNPLPLSVLAGFSGAETAHTEPVRALVVSAGETGVQAYVWDGGQTYRRYTTAVTRSSLESVVSRYELGNASFAADLQQEGMAPYCLFLEEEPMLPVVSRSVPVYDTDAVLEALQFNPNTQSRYQETSGTEVIVESSRSLRLRTDGSILYQSGGEDTLRVEAGENPTLQELVAASGALMEKLSVISDGDAHLYLERVRQSGDIVTLYYSYAVEGVPIRFYDGDSTAVITLSGATVSELTMRLRRYTVTEESSLLLPVRQAAAIMGQYEETELFLGYADDGSERMSARWLAES